MSNIYFMCENCGIETNGITFVNGMKFCTKCYHQIFGKDNQQIEITQLKQQLAEKDCRIEELEGQFAYECECNKQLVDLQKQLEEKQKTIDEINKEFVQAVHDWKALCAEKDQRLAELEKQLDQANERLKGVIVPKFKIGQEVYKVYTKDQKFPFRAKIVGFKVTRTEEKNSVLYDTAEDGFDMDWCPEKILFEALEEAKKKLQELRGGE